MFKSLLQEIASNRTWNTVGCRLRQFGMAALLGVSVYACSSDKVTAHLPLPGPIDPDSAALIDAAVRGHAAALTTFRTVSDLFIPLSGLLADELNFMTVNIPEGMSSNGPEIALDSRTLPEYTFPGREPGGYADLYNRLQRLRGQITQAIGALQKYAPDSTALRGHLYSAHAYTILMLGDLFCSGLPLSTIDYEGKYTFASGLPTVDIYLTAAAYFDTALALSGDSSQLMNLARVGKARALLGAGDFDGANQAALSIVDRFQYQLQFPMTDGNRNFAQIPKPGYSSWAYTVADREGVRGLDYRSSGDPRTVSSAAATNAYGGTLYHPNKYSGTGNSPIVLADWVEARLIRAEVALRNNQIYSWINFLNTLRRTAISPSIPDLTDPGTYDTRVDLMFRERGFWLFLTGHRQGDMRRLIRQYRRSQDAVYPILDYPAGGTGWYGSDVAAPVPATERLVNQFFQGCLHRDA